MESLERLGEKGPRFGKAWKKSLEPAGCGQAAALAPHEPSWTRGARLLEYGGNVVRGDRGAPEIPCPSSKTCSRPSTPTKAPRWTACSRYSKFLRFRRSLRIF